MYSDLPNYIIGFHGTTREIATGIIENGDPFEHKENTYDWLGNGSYFWEQNHDRALHFASNIKKFDDPVVIGVVLHLGNCINLLDDKYIRIIDKSYNYLYDKRIRSGSKMPQNRPLRCSGDLIFRDLDCEVVHTAIELIEEETSQTIDSVRGAFWEGKELYPNAGFREYNHIQICIRNHDCIKGCFWPKVRD